MKDYMERFFDAHVAAQLQREGVSLPILTGMKARMSGWLINLIVLILKVILAAVTPILRDALEEFLIQKYLDALQTENPYDELLFEFLLRILSIPIPSQT